ncbi:ROK family protein [Enterococcus sp. AZ109]|uniref:ROK family protein n=1 Tax=Enterococcus sp. AZ109 TaxID=2774634 RepID=UPI003F287044
MSNYLSIDIGGTNIKYGVLDHSGNLTECSCLPTPVSGLEEFLEAVYQLADPYAGFIRGIGVSVPGKVETKTGTIYFGGSLPFLDGVCLKELLERRYQLPVAVENDGKAATLAEIWLGSLKDIDTCATLILGTGVGGGIVVNGKLLKGSHFQAGELSFMINEDHLSGMDKLLGVNGSAVNMIEAIAKQLNLPDKKDGKGVFQELNQGNSLALPLFTRYCHRLAVAILNIQTVIDGTAYAIGGGISGQPLVVETINQQYDQLLDELPLLKQTFVRPVIKKAKFENQANLYGAVYSLLLALDQNEAVVSIS